MIAVGLSLMILAGLVTVFVNNSNTRREIERTARQIESGRYGTDLLSNNIAHAAFFAEFDPTQLSAPVAIPQACSTLASDIRDGMAVPIHGYRNATTGTPGLGCLEGLKPLATRSFTVTYTGMIPPKLFPITAEARVDYVKWTK